MDVLVLLLFGTFRAACCEFWTVGTCLKYGAACPLHPGVPRGVVAVGEENETAVVHF